MYGHFASSLALGFLWQVKLCHKKRFILLVLAPLGLGSLRSFRFLAGARIFVAGEALPQKALHLLVLAPLGLGSVASW